MMWEIQQQQVKYSPGLIFINERWRTLSITAVFAFGLVKVLLVPEGHVMTVAFAIGLSVQELKHHFASELRVPPEVLRISLDGKIEFPTHNDGFVVLLV